MASQHLTLALTSDKQGSNNQFVNKDSSTVNVSHQVGDSLDKCDRMTEDCNLSSNWDPVRASDSLLESSHRDDGMQKSFDREERLRLAKERQAEEKQRKLRDLKESNVKAQEFRRKQEEERRKKYEDMKRREDEHRATVEERRKKLLQEQKEKVRAVMKKNDDRKVKVVERKPRKRDKNCLMLQLHNISTVDAISAAVESCTSSPRLSTSSKLCVSNSLTQTYSHELCGAKSRYSCEREPKNYVSPPQSPRSGCCLEGRAKACRSEDTLSGSSSPWKSVPLRQRPHSIAGRYPSYAGHTVASQLRRSQGDEMFTSAVFCCSRFRSVSPTPTEMKGRAHSTDSSRKSRIDQQQQGHTSGRKPLAMSSVSAARSNVQQPPPHSNLPLLNMPVAPVKVKSTPSRPNQLVGVSPAGGHLMRTPRRPLRTPSPKTMPASVAKPSDKSTHRVLPSPQKMQHVTPHLKANNGREHADVVASKPPVSSLNKDKLKDAHSLQPMHDSTVKTALQPMRDVTAKTALQPMRDSTVKAALQPMRESTVNTANKKLPLCDSSSLSVEKTVDLTSGALVDKCEPFKHVVEEEYKLKLSEKRRQARELAERKVAEEKRLEEVQRKAEEEERLRMEEEERRHEQEELRLIEEAKQSEHERLQKAMKEENERRRMEEERLETERKERLASEQKLKEENERREQERLEKSRRDEEDRAERKKKLELIMKRVKVDDNISKVDSSPISSTCASITYDQQEGRPLASSEQVTSPLDNVTETSTSFRSPFLQQMMVTRAKSQLPGETSKESSIERADSTESPELPASHSNYDKKCSIENEHPQQDVITQSSSAVSTILEPSSNDVVIHSSSAVSPIPEPPSDDIVALHLSSTVSTIPEPPSDDIVAHLSSTVSTIPEPSSNDVITHSSSTVSPIPEPSSDDVITHSSSAVSPIPEPSANDIVAHLSSTVSTIPEPSSDDIVTHLSSAVSTIPEPSSDDVITHSSSAVSTIPEPSANDIVAHLGSTVSTIPEPSSDDIVTHLSSTVSTIPEPSSDDVITHSSSAVSPIPEPSSDDIFTHLSSTVSTIPEPSSDDVITHSSSAVSPIPEPSANDIVAHLSSTVSTIPEPSSDDIVTHSSSAVSTIPEPSFDNIFTHSSSAVSTIPEPSANDIVAHSSSAVSRKPEPSSDDIVTHLSSTVSTIPEPSSDDIVAHLSSAVSRKPEPSSDDIFTHLSSTVSTIPEPTSDDVVTHSSSAVSTIPEPSFDDILTHSSSALSTMPEPSANDIFTHLSSTVFTIQETSSDFKSYLSESSFTNSELMFHPGVVHLQTNDSNSAMAETSRWSSEIDTFFFETSNAVTSNVSSSFAAAGDTNVFDPVPALITDNMPHYSTHKQKSSDSLLTLIPTTNDNGVDNTDGCNEKQLHDDSSAKGSYADYKLDPAHINLEVKKSEDFLVSETLLVAGEEIDLLVLPDNQSVNGFGKLLPDEEKAVLYDLPQISSVEESQIRSSNINFSSTIENNSQKLTVIDDEANELTKVSHQNQTCLFDPPRIDAKSSAYLFDVSEEGNPVTCLNKPGTNFSADASETSADTFSFVTSIHPAPVNLFSNVNDELSAKTSCSSVPHCIDDLFHQTVIPTSESDYLNPVSSSSNNNESCQRENVDNVDVCYPILSNEDGVLLHMLSQSVDDDNHSVHLSTLNVEEGSLIVAPSVLTNCSKNECCITSMSVADHGLIDMCVADIEAPKGEEKCVGHSLALHSVHAGPLSSKLVDQYFGDLIQPESSSDNYVDIDNTTSTLVNSILSDNVEYSNDKRGTIIHTELEITRDKLPRYLELNAADLIEGVYRSRALDTDSLLMSNIDAPSHHLTNPSTCKELSAVTADVSSFWLESNLEKSSAVDVPPVDTRQSDTIDDMERPDVAMPSDEDKDISVADLPDCLLRESSPDFACQIGGSSTCAAIPDSAEVKLFSDNLRDEYESVSSLENSETCNTQQSASVTYLESNAQICLTNEQVVFSGLPNTLPVVAFEDGGRHVRPPLSGTSFDLP